MIKVWKVAEMVSYIIKSTSMRKIIHIDDDSFVMIYEYLMKIM